MQAATIAEVTPPLMAHDEVPQEPGGASLDLSALGLGGAAVLTAGLSAGLRLPVSSRFALVFAGAALLGRTISGPNTKVSVQVLPLWASVSWPMGSLRAEGGIEVVRVNVEATLPNGAAEEDWGIGPRVGVVWPVDLVSTSLLVAFHVVWQPLAGGFDQDGLRLFDYPRFTATLGVGISLDLGSARRSLGSVQAR